MTTGEWSQPLLDAEGTRDRLGRHLDDVGYVEDHAEGQGKGEERDEARDPPGEEEEQCDDGHDDEEERGEEGAQELGEPFGVDAGGWGGGRHLDEGEQYGLE